MRAEILSVGTELLLGQIVDTNAAYLSQVLSKHGVTLYRRTNVGDNHERLLSAIKDALSDNDIVFTIGGLGPTMDDITRETLAEAFDTTLTEDPAIHARLERFFHERGIRMSDNNLRQALVPGCGRTIDNPNGTAPGLLFEKDGKAAIAMPGPPNEFIPMVDNHVVPYLRAKTGGCTTIRSRVLRICGMGESLVEDTLKDLMQGDNPTVAPYAKTGEVHLRVTSFTNDAEEADRLINVRVGQLEERLGSHVYGYDDETLEMAVVRLLKERNLTVATAESCTGGMLGARITSVSGSSSVYPGGAITYCNRVKSKVLSVPENTLNSVGAVSPEVASAMAIGTRELLQADFGVGITGIAGPDGGTPEKPVGLVYIAVAGGNGVTVEKNLFLGNRQDVRYRSTQVALVMLRDSILAHR